MTAPIVFVDTETTSLRRPYRPAGRRIWEIGMIRREPDGTEREKGLLVYDVDLRDADPASLAVGRFHERHVRGNDHPLANPAAPDAPQVAEEAKAAATVQRWTTGAHLVGAVPAFEDLGLEDLLYRHGLCPGWHYHLCCVENLAAGKLGLQPPWDSDELSRKLGVEVSDEDKHTALGDARWAKAVYDAVMGLP